jgi:RNA polymerase sigma-70 factor (ECF subfamily)
MAGSSQVQGEGVPVVDFRRLFDEHYDYVWVSLRRLGVQERDLEDLVHDVFLQVHAKLATYDRARPAKPWLFAFAFRIASDYRRLARHKTELRSDPDLPGSEPSVEDRIASAESAELLRRALDALSLEMRAVLVAYEIDEIPMKDITEALGIPLHTGYSRLRLGREQCAVAVRRLRGETEAP